MMRFRPRVGKPSNAAGGSGSPEDLDPTAPLTRSASVRALARVGAIDRCTLGALDGEKFSGPAVEPERKRVAERVRRGSRSDPGFGEPAAEPALRLAGREPGPAKAGRGTKNRSFLFLFMCRTTISLAAMSMSATSNPNADPSRSRLSHVKRAPRPATLPGGARPLVRHEPADDSVRKLGPMRLDPVRRLVGSDGARDRRHWPVAHVRRAETGQGVHSPYRPQ